MSGAVEQLFTLDPGQMAAAHPADHVWLGASAGTGKTQVLSARVLRLMLGGVVPDAILCITFTKAGAAEMAHRIHDRLARWVRMDDGTLRIDLLALGLDPLRAGLIDRARSLFATVIDSPSGAIRVQTIHSFCQALLASFPLEADILPGFKAMEDGEARELQRQTLAALLLATGDAGDRNRARAAVLTRRLGQDAAIAFLGRCVGLFGAPDPVALPPTAFDLRAALDLPTGDPAVWIASEITAGAIAAADLQAVIDAGVAWDTKTGLARVETIAIWRTAGAAQQVVTLAGLRDCLIRKSDGVLSADFAEPGKKMGDAGAAATNLLHAINHLLGTASAMQVADDLAAGWALGADFAAAYARAKREGGRTDYDDLITIAGDLLRTSDFGEWVRFKMDQRTDHILVDEAQDTNTRQWVIVNALAGEFFAGSGAKDDRIRTLFTVGDRKQAIFGFQGTDPIAFEAARLLFRMKAEAAERPFQDIDLVTNYRSSPAILAVVDQWLASGGTAALGVDDAVPAHVSSRPNLPGRVELWQPIPVEAALDESDPGDDAFGGDDDDASTGDALAPANDPASVRLARAIADEVKDWLANGVDGRMVSPGDILILVRRRRDLAARIVARLQAGRVPVAGVDRFALNQPLAVQDLAAAMRFAVQPHDDLTLAALLVSPLLGWSQDDLYNVAHQRGAASLWEALRAQTGGHIEKAKEVLGALLAMADYVTPFRFLETILSGPLDGRRKLLRRLGPEARSPIDELLAQALAFEQQQVPSLLGFLDWLDSNRIEIKRQSDARSNLVRVMTVHGSKGLQAPIVILADATDDPLTGKQDVAIDVHGWEKLPVFPLGKDERHGAIAAAHDKAVDAALQEHWRLLYVAMTRAQQMLVVTGTVKSKDRSLPENCWHSAVDRTLAAMECDWQDAGPRWGARRLYAANAGKWAKDGKKGARIAPQPLAIPDWAHRPAPEEARPPRPLAPSALGADDVASPPASAGRQVAIARGVLLHALFERLPAVAPERRVAAAERWLAVQARDLDAGARAVMAAEVLAVLGQPEWAALFEPGSLAEVPLSAIVDGVVVAGIVDRLLVTGDMVTVIDYKTGHHVPASAYAVAPAYLRQMAAYTAALRVIFPGRTVQAALLYTAGPRLITLDDAMLAAHKPGLADAKANLPPNPESAP